MKTIPKLLTISLVSAFALAACAGGAGSNPFANASSAREAAVTPDAPPAIDGIAGEYIGSVNDSVVGKGKADFTLSQIAGGQAGGSMQLKFGTIEKASSALALDASNPKSITGNAVALFGTSAPCTLTISAKFNRKTYMLTGSYKAFNNCLSGQSGTFSAKEQCYYVVAKPIAEGLRSRTVPKNC